MDTGEEGKKGREGKKETHLVRQFILQQKANYKRKKKIKTKIPFKPKEHYILPLIFNPKQRKFIKKTM